MKNAELLFFTAVNLLNYLDRYLLAAVLPLVAADLTLTNEQSGRLVSAFVFGYFIFSPIFGSLGDRMRRPMLMAFGVAAWSVATLGTGLCTTFLTLMLVRAFVGIGEASFATIAPSYLKDRIQDPSKLSNALAVFFSAIPVGSALGYVVAGAIAERYSWQMVFFVGGIPGIFLALLLLKAPEVRREAPAKGSMKDGVKAIFGHPILRCAILGYALQTFALTGIATFITKLGVELGFTVQSISTAFGIILVGTGLGGTLLGGRLANSIASKAPDRTQSFFKFIAASSFLGAPFLALAFIVQDKALFLVMCFLAELFIFASTAPLNSILVSSAPTRYVALTQGVTIFAINLLGSMLGPILVGLTADAFSLSTGLQLTTVALILSGIVWLYATRAPKRLMSAM